MNDLTANAERILATVRLRGRYPVADLHRNTIKALMRRGLVEYGWWVEHGIRRKVIVPVQIKDPTP